MPLLRRKRVLAAKIETTVGEALATAAGDAAFNVFEAGAQPNIDYAEREGQSAFSPLPGALGAYGGTITFQVELTGGAATPAWAETFLPACGWKETASVFAPLSEAPGTNVKTLTIRMYEDGVVKGIRGAMGTAVLRFVAGERVMIEFTFTGLWIAPSDVAILAPTYPTTAPIRFVSSGLLIGGTGGWSPPLQELTIDLGNEVILREDSTDSTGYASALITGRRITGTMNPEASLIATEDVYGKWLLRTEQALAIDLGSTNNSADISAPKLQFTNLQEGDRNANQIDDIEFQLNRSASAGDDELEIDLSG